MDIQSFIDLLFVEARKQGAEQYQIKYAETERSELQIFEQKVSKQVAAKVQKLNLAVKVGDKVGHFVSECFEPSEIPFIVSEAIANAKLLDCDEKFFFYDGQGEYKKLKPYAPLADKLKDFDVVAYLKKAEKLAYDADERIKQVIATAFHKKSNKLIMRNSLGLDLQEENKSASAYIFLSAQDESGVKSFSHAVCFDKPEDFEPKNLVMPAVEQVLAHLSPTEIVPQKTAVVFENKQFAGLLGEMADIFDAYEVDCGKSQLKGKIGEQIASSLVTIVDDPWLVGGFATEAFDGDGVPTKYKEVVKGGVLQTFLYGLSMADKHQCASTGNGSGAQGAKIFNFYLKNGETSFSELLALAENGVFIDKIKGLGVGFNAVTGDVSAAAEGFVIEKGKVTKPLKQFTFSCNIYQLLKDIRAIGNDLEFYCSQVGSPSVLVDNVTIVNS